MASRIHFKYWEIFWFRDFMSNFREMASQWLRRGSRKSFKLSNMKISYIESFEARDLEILQV